MPIISVSGIRGVVNSDIDARYSEAIGSKFGSFVGGGQVAIASDTRTSSSVIKNAVLSGLVASGCTVYDLGLSSTPSVFKEVAVRKLDGGLVITASHNPPEWNGIKFVLKGGRGVFEDELDAIQNTVPRISTFGRVYESKARYIELLKAKAGRAAANGIVVALDLAGGVGSVFIPSLLAFQGCKVHTVNSTPGVFSRTIDPTVDPLTSLSNEVTSAECDVGFAYDCDADRLVIVDQKGEKLSGDATLLICLRYFLENTRNRRVAVSVDTSLAAEDLVREYNGKVLYSKVGEANVVRKIIENDCGAGGEGSSGGYIEPAFVTCRDGVYASTMIVRMIKSEGSLHEITKNFKTYFQDRAKLEIERKYAHEILSSLAKTESDVDMTDGVKIRRSNTSWVLVRSSNTENVIRVSAEARTKEQASSLLKEYSSKILGIASAYQK